MGRDDQTPLNLEPVGPNALLSPLSAVGMRTLQMGIVLGSGTRPGAAKYVPG